MLIADREIAADSADPIPIDPKGNILQVLVRDNNIDQALRFLKKKMQREGVFREMKQRRFYEKPSERTNREKAEAIRRARKVARKKLQREGLLPDPRKMKPDASKSPRQRPAFEIRPSQGQFPRPTGNVAR